jgi:hypothetical protein
LKMQKWINFSAHVTCYIKSKKNAM